MKLLSDVGNFQALKVAIAARLTNCDVDFVEVKNNACVISFLVKSKLPVLELSDGTYLFSANSAAKYLYLRAGKIIDEDAENQILDWEFSQVLPVVSAYLVSAVGHGKKDKDLSEQLVKVLQELDTKLAKTTFLLEDGPGVCDICLFSTVFPLLGLKNLDCFASLSNVQRWCAELQALPAVQEAVSQVFKGNTQELLKASLLSQSFPQLPTGHSSGKVTAKTNKSGLAKAAPVPQGGGEEEQVEEKVPQEELDSALKAWKTDPSQCTKPRVRKHPILPEKSGRNILVTSALPYVNNVPHLGNIIGCVLSADVFSRFARLRNYNVLYISGTDEYGTATETKAVEEKVTPQEICDKYNKLHTQIYQWFNIDFDHFGRTTTKQQTEIAQDIFWKLHDAGYILKDSVDQLYCGKCDKFLADRFVEGICPMCGFDDARGDQCDGCGKLINAVDLVSPKCKMCKSSPQVKTSNHLFLDLPKLEPQLKTHLDAVFESGTWTNNARVITSSWLRDGLKPRCISRDLKWGTPIPLEGYTNKVFYVWYDAPIGYISITANYTSEWKQWWKSPNKVEMYNFLGKDNVPFHSVIFPACLLGTDDNYTVVKHMLATEYLNYEDTKFSKSRGSGVFGDHAETTGIPADIYRFYLLFMRPESQDTAFSWDDFLLKNNTELLNNLGNFINRALMFLNNNFNGTIQEMEVTEDDVQLMALVTRELQNYVSNQEACRQRDGIRNILSISRLGNQYMQVNKPWVLAKGTPQERKRAGCVVSVSANLACLLSVLLQPYMPATSATIQQQLQAPQDVNVITGQLVARLPPGHRIGKPSPLFQKIETSTIEELKVRFAGKPQEKAPPKKHGAKSTVPATVNGSPASPEEIERLTKLVSDQGNKVRELKAAKAEQSVIKAEVESLLRLKQDLAAAQGQSTADVAGGKGKKKGGGGKGDGTKKDAGGKQGKAGESATAGGESKGVTAVNGPEVERLTQAVSEQGNKVRDLKAAKGEKSEIDAAVATLLQLKRELCLAQGVNPDTVTGGSKKDKKKKK